MGDFLLGGEESGTPQETRGAVGDIGEQLRQLLSGGGGDLPFGRQRAEATTRGLGGLDLSALGLQGVAGNVLSDPNQVVGDLFETLRPFEERQTAESVEGLRSMFGTLGGRFGRNIAQGEAQLRSGLAEGFARNRAQQAIPAILQARGQQLSGLLGLLGAGQGAGGLANQEIDQFLQLLQPGAPQQREGALGGILGAGATLGGAALLN